MRLWGHWSMWWWSPMRKTYWRVYRVARDEICQSIGKTLYKLGPQAFSLHPPFIHSLALPQHIGSPGPRNARVRGSRSRFTSMDYPGAVGTSKEEEKIKLRDVDLCTIHDFALPHDSPRVHRALLWLSIADYRRRQSQPCSHVPGSAIDRQGSEFGKRRSKIAAC